MRKQARGFTLLELLAAMAMTAAVAGSLYASLYIGVKAHRSSTEAAARARSGVLALELLRQDFNAALPPTGVMAGGFIGSDATGANSVDSLSFYSAANVPLETETASDMRAVELSIVTIADDARPALIRRLTTNLLPSGTPTVREQVLCRNVSVFNLRYFDGLSWLDSWDSGGQDNTLPVAVEVTLEFAPESSPENEQRPRLETVRRLTRVYPLPCGVALQDATASGS